MVEPAEVTTVARKAGHGGKRDGAGRKPTSGRDDVTVKVERSIVAKARYVAAIRDITLAEMISELLRPIVDREFAKASKGASDA